MSGTVETLSNVIFADGEMLSGTFTASYNATTGALASVSTFSLTILVGTTSVTLNNADATATVQTASETGPGGQPLYQIYVAVNSTSAAYATVHNVYLDYTPNASALYTLTAPAQTSPKIESRYTSIADSSSSGFASIKLSSTGGGTLSPASPPCFMAGTSILTTDGEIAVEDLKVGMMLLTNEGKALPMRWLGHSTVSTRFTDPLRVLPIRIEAGALGQNLPSRDLLVSPDHAVLIGDVLIHAGALVNEVNIRREANVPETFKYYHVELASHEVLIAEGTPVESFIDNVDRMNFDNWAEHGALADMAPIVEMSYPRAKSYRQVPVAVRALLAARIRQEDRIHAASAA